MFLNGQFLKTSENFSETTAFSDTVVLNERKKQKNLCISSELAR
jgi:hypothetical protein